MHAKHLLSPTLIAAVLLCGAARAQTPEDQARAVFEARRAAVVTVQIVTKVKTPNGERESKSDITGTVISPEGLTVVALSATDPMRVAKAVDPDNPRFADISTEVADVRILLDGGAEAAAQIVLRDADLDLAYVQPREKPAAPMAFVDLADSAAPRILDAVVALNRLGKVANRVHAASIERIEAIVDRPRTFYIPAASPTNSAQGSPVFTLDNKVVGIFVIRAIRQSDSGGNMFRGNDNVMPILLPAKDVLDGAKQAPPIG